MPPPFPLVTPQTLSPEMSLPLFLVPLGPSAHPGTELPAQKGLLSETTVLDVVWVGVGSLVGDGPSLSDRVGSEAGVPVIWSFTPRLRLLWGAGSVGDDAGMALVVTLPLGEPHSSLGRDSHKVLYRLLSAC